MGWVTGIVVYFLIWWITLFAVLPWWVTPADSDDPGYATGRTGAAAAAVEAGHHNGRVGGHLAGGLRPGEVSMAQFPRAMR